MGFNEREILDVEARFDWNELARAGASLSLFASRRLIELRLPTGRADRDGAVAIAEWCKSLAADTVLVIIASEWSKKHEIAWVREVERTGVYLWIRPPRVDQLPAWIRTRMRARGFAPDDDAVALLASRAEGNLLAIAQEIDKLAMLREGGRVSAAELEALDADNALFDVFKLTDAAFAGDATRALRVLAGLRGEGEELIPMLGWLDHPARTRPAPRFRGRLQRGGARRIQLLGSEAETFRGLRSSAPAAARRIGSIAWRGARASTAWRKAEFWTMPAKPSATRGGSWNACWSRSRSRARWPR